MPTLKPIFLPKAEDKNVRVNDFIKAVDTFSRDVESTFKDLDYETTLIIGDTPLHDLPEIESLTDDDIFLVEDDPSGEANSGQCTMSTLATYMQSELTFITDHGGLSGLSDDDHAQYALLGGRSGGQIIKGGIANGEDLSFWTNATGVVGKYFFTDLFTNGFIKTINTTGELAISSTINDFTTKDHDLLTGLGDDDHTQYLLIDGTRSMTGALDAPAHNISDKLITATIFTSAGINACIDALGAEGGEVYLPEGTYDCTTAIVIDYDKTTLTGAGYSTILDFSVGQASPSCIDTNDRDYVIIQNLTIIGSAGSGVTSALIGDGDIANFLTVKNCKLRLGDNVGINNNGSDSKIMNNYFDHMDGTSVYLGGNGQRDLVEGNYFDDGTISLNLQGGDYVKIVNNYFQDSSAQAILAGGVHAGIFSGNTIKNCDRGINIAGSSNGNIISNNKIYNTTSGDYDIKINEDYNTIVNNNCYGSGTSDKGIWLDEADHCIVSGNFTVFHDIAGIQEDADCQNNLIYGNRCKDATPYIINGTAHETFYQHGDISLKFGDLVSEQNPDGADAIRIKGTSDIDVVIGSMSGLFAVWNVADDTPVFYVNERGDTDITGDLIVDTNTLFVDAGNNRVGIGVTDPDTKLEIFNAGTQLKLSFDASNFITLATQSDGDLTIDSNKASYDLDFGDGNLITTGTITGEQITSTDDIAVPQTGKFQFEGTAGDTHMVFDGTSIQVVVNNVLVWEFN